MDSDTIQLAVIMLVPIAAITGGIWQKIIKTTQQHREEMARIQATQRTSLDANSTSALNSLRQELAALRDTTTQYDISVERNMHEVMQRLSALETKAMPRPIDAPVHAPSARGEYVPDVRTPQPEEIPQRLQAGS